MQTKANTTKHRNKSQLIQSINKHKHEINKQQHHTHKHTTNTNTTGNT